MALRGTFDSDAEQKQRTIDQRLRYNLGRWNQKPRVELKLKP
jgi:hypothetical protein